MNRRSFILKTVVGTGASFFLPAVPSYGNLSKRQWQFISNTTPLETIILSDALKQPLTVLQLSDTHISCDNENDLEYERYSKGMYKAYKQVQHYKTGAVTSPANCFGELMNLAKQEKVDLIVLTGDIVNYPSATAVEFVRAALASTGIPHIYTAGNHDWHYDGMAGSEEYLRKEWCEKRLKPLYTGGILFSSRIVGGINMVTIDNSFMEINHEQLEFFDIQLARPEPVALFVHIPLYIPSMDLCCGHPQQWSSNKTKNLEDTVKKYKASTEEFIRQTFAAKNLIGIFAGHWHEYRTLTYGYISQHLALPGFNGQYRLIRFLPVEV